ncbi:MAG: hypothetical protein R3185_03755, partial [Candidatus Thermoplasmatota archaeon]|nr:hypothetical protein [Candidatus Thermoplasmatota archaeon]
EHTYNGFANHDVTLRVTDNAGATDTYTESVWVGPDDPGFAYVDADCDDRWDPGTDDDLTDDYDSSNVDIHRGACIVIPPSTPLSPDGSGGARGEVDIHAQSVFIGANLTAQTHRIHLSIEEDIRIVPGVTLYAGGDKIDMQAKGGTLTMNNVTVHSPDHEIKIKADGHNLYAYGATIKAPHSQLTIQDKAEHVDLREATVEAGDEVSIDGITSLRADGASFTSGNSSVILWTETMFRAENATFQADADVDLGVDAADMQLNNTAMTSTAGNLLAEVSSPYWARIQGASFTDTNNLLDVTPDGRSTGTPASGGTE